MHSKVALFASSSIPALSAPLRTRDFPSSQLSQLASELSEGTESFPETSSPITSEVFQSSDIDKRDFIESDIELLNRAVSLPVGSLGAELGKGFAVGGGLAGLAAAADHFLKGDSSDAQTQKCALSASDIELLKRVVSLGSLGAQLGKGLAVGGGLTGLEALASHFLGGGDTQDQSQKREWTNLEARQLGKLLGTAAEDTVGDVLKKGLVNGAGAAVGGSLVGGLISELTGNNKQKRHHKHNKAFKTANASSGGSNAVSSSPQVSEPHRPLPLGPELHEPNQQKRQLAKLFGTAAEDTLGDVLKKGLVNGAGAAVGGSVVGGLIDEFTGNNNKREPIEIGTFEKAIASHAASLGASTIVGDGIDKIEGPFDGNSNSNDKREPIELGTVGKGILGTAASLGASALIGDGIDKIEGLFGGNSNSKREASLDDLD